VISQSAYGRCRGPLPHHGVFPVVCGSIRRIPPPARLFHRQLVRIDLSKNAPAGRVRFVCQAVDDCSEDAHGSGWRQVFGTALRGAAAVLTRLREQGIIRAWGPGVNRVARLGTSEPGRYSLLNQPALDSLFSACVERGAHVVVGGPYDSGGDNYEYQRADDAIVAVRDRLIAIGSAYKVRPARSGPSILRGPSCRGNCPS
jgi:hypothetical protein